jgi:uncharacterized membrane protein
MPTRITELEDLAEMLSLAIARERDLSEYYTRAYLKAASAGASATIQRELLLVAKQEMQHVAKLRKQLHEIRSEIMRARGPRRLEASIVIDVSPQEVFAFLADAARGPEWQSLIEGVEITSQESTGVGAAFHYLGAAGGARGEWDTENTAWVENERIAWRTTSGDWNAFGSWTLQAVEGGTKVINVLNYGLPYSILGQVIDRLRVSRDLEKGLARDLQTMKDLLEG